MASPGYVVQGMLSSGEALRCTVYVVSFMVGASDKAGLYWSASLPQATSENFEHSGATGLGPKPLPFSTSKRESVVSRLDEIALTTG